MKSQASTYNEQVTSPSADRFLTNVFMWLFLALAISSVCLYLFNYIDSCMRLLFANGKPTVLAWFSIPAPVILALIIRHGINRISYPGLCVLFVIYSALVGTCFSFILLDWVDSSLLGVFLSSAVVFGVMAVAGYITKTDLSKFRSLLMMLVIGILVATIIVFCFPGWELQFWVSCLWVAVFLGLTTFHMQDLKSQAETIDHNDPSAKKMALLGGLTLYFDFVNLFVFLIKMFGTSE
jgi:FtsH-binding integral membrane protein